MTIPASPHRETTSQLDTDAEVANALRTAAKIKELWRAGAPPSLAGVLANHPELKAHRTVVLDLGYEEFRLRLQAGEALDVEEFSRQFRGFSRSLYCFIGMRSALGSDPEYADFQDTMTWPEPGSRFLGFDLIAEIGRGAIGRVFLASEPALGERQVVVKVALEGGHEAEILGRLRHANIVPVYAIYEDAETGLTAFCMPFLGQATLAKVLDALPADRRPVLRAQAILDAVRTANAGADVPDSPADRVLRGGTYVEGVIHVGAQLAEALAHAHAQGIFHRDLKPPNILISPDGRPLLLDFNLSLDEDHPVWRVGGTLPYMAPEELSALCDANARSRSPAYDARSDLFSLGVILYEMLTGDFPFGAIPCDRSVEDIAAHLRKRQAAGPRPVRERNRHVDRRLARLIEHCLAFDADLRPANAAALAAALRRELTPAPRTRRWVAAHRRSVLVVAAVAMLLVLGTIVFLALRPPYSVRQLQQGLAYFQAGRDDLALPCLNASLSAAPSQSETLVARAHVHQRLGEFEQAFADYDATDRLTSSPKIVACKGYCLNRLAQHKEAAYCYRRSLQAGYDLPAVWNNLGYSWFQTGRLAEAETCLRRALQGDDGLQAAHHNLVLLFLQQAYAGKTVPPEAFVHARRALEIGPESGELCRNVAFLHVLAAKQDAVLARAAIAYVARAVAHGLDPHIFRSDPAFLPLEKDPAFQEALASPGTVQGPTRAMYVIDPAGEPR